MALVPIRVDRTSKPPIGTPLRSDGHWSVQGLVGAWAFNEGAGKTAFDGLGLHHGAVGSATAYNADYLRFINYSPETYVDINGLPDFVDKHTVFCLFDRGTAANTTCLLSKTDGTTENFSIRFGTGVVILGNGWNPSITAPSGTGKSSVAFTQNAGYKRLFSNGVFASENTFTNRSSVAGLLSVGSYGPSHGGSGSFKIFSFCVYATILTSEQIASLSANPWQIYEPETVWIEVGGGGEAALFSGAIYGKSSASANLSTAVVLAAAAQGSSTAQAALSTALELAAQVNGTGSATGALGVDISGLAGSLNGSSEAQATLSTAIHLMGIAAGQCGVVGRLAEPVEILAQLRVMASNPLALTISVRDPLALRVTVH